MKGQIIPLQALRPVSGWEEFFRHGEGYLNTALAAHQKGVRAFTPEILYNLAAMAIEKFVMAALMRHGAMPYNHTMADLVEAMERAFPGQLAELRERVLALDRYQEICDADAWKRVPPGPEEIPAMLEVAEGMRSLAHRAIA